VLDVHVARLAADDLHRVGNTLRLHLAFGALLALDLDLRILALQSCVAASFLDTALATSSGYCTLPTTTLVITNGRFAA
jgi:hypothetical protein